jgi:hypothetical protein
LRCQENTLKSVLDLIFGRRVEKNVFFYWKENRKKMLGFLCCEMLWKMNRQISRKKCVVMAVGYGFIHCGGRKSVMAFGYRSCGGRI